MDRCPDIVASRDLHGANERLRSWAGAHALVLGSGITHRHFRIDLWKEGVDTQLAVLCAIPEYYCGPIGWSGALVRVVRASEADLARYRRTFEVCDEGAGVRLLCDEVRLFEEPAFHWRTGAVRQRDSEG